MGTGPADRYAKSVATALERVYAIVRDQGIALRLSTEEARLLIVSDLHRGVRDGADDFERCDATYCAALRHAFSFGHTLVVLGDAEELWECGPAAVIAANRGSLEIEAEFHRAGRYHRIAGNHDDHWDSPAAVRELLGPLFGPSFAVRPGMRLLFEQGTASIGEIFLVHGHQGTCAGDHQRRPMRFVVRHFWRPFQRLTKCKLTTPARDHALRSRHDRAVHAWAQRMPGLAIVVGHTHAPVFESQDHVSRLRSKLAAALAAGDRTTAGAVRGELQYRQQQTNGQAFAMDRPCYFNTGCCSYRDGDVTGIEISDGNIRLVRWAAGGTGSPVILQEASLRKVFDALRT